MQYACLVGHFSLNPDSAVGARVTAYAEGLAQLGIGCDIIGCTRDGIRGVNESGLLGTFRSVETDGPSRRISIFSLDRSETPQVSRLRSARLHLVRLLVFWIEVARWLRHRPSGMLVLCGQHGPMLTVAAVFARVGRRQVLLDVMEWFTRSSRPQLFFWLSELTVQRVVPKLATHASVISEEAGRQLPTSLPRTVVTSMISREWADTIRSTASQAHSDNRFICVFSGSENRGVQNLVVALDELAAQHPERDFELRLTGVRHAARRVNLSSNGKLRIEHMGSLERSDYAALLKQATCLVIPGDSGTDKDNAFPNRLTEYLLSGTPTILAGYPAAARRLKHLKEVLLLPCSRPDLLQGALEKVLLDTHLAETLGRGGRDAAERLFDPVLVVKPLVKDLFGH